MRLGKSGRSKTNWPESPMYFERRLDSRHHGPQRQCCFVLPSKKIQKRIDDFLIRGWHGETVALKGLFLNHCGELRLKFSAFTYCHYQERDYVKAKFTETLLILLCTHKIYVYLVIQSIIINFIFIHEKAKAKRLYSLANINLINMQFCLS